jgi:hypothetical protein
VKITKIYKAGAVIGKNPEISLSETTIESETWVDYNAMTFKLVTSEIESAPSLASHIVDDFKENSQPSQSQISSSQRVILDVFHVLHRIKFKKNHLRKSFFEAFRDALFECDNEDVENVKTILRAKGLTNGKIDSMFSKWIPYLQKRVRRRIPKAEILVSRLQQVYQMYNDKKDRKNRPLFSSSNKSEFIKIIDHARRGCISDPKDVEILC